MYKKFVAKFNNISFTIILGICTLLPLFFLPASVSGLGAVKGAVLYIGVFLSFSLWLVAQFIDGTIRIPKHKVIMLLGVWILFSLISALVSINPTLSLWGRGFVIDSFATVLVLSLFAFLVATFSRDQRKLVKLFLGAFAGSVITILLQVLLYVFGNTSFVTEHFGHIARGATLVGSWVDFAYFVTFTFVLSLLMFEVLVPKGFFRVLSLVAMVLSLIVLIFLNFKAAWIITVISSLLVFVYKFSVERSMVARMKGSLGEGEEQTEPQQFPLMSFIALLIGLFFFLSNNSIGAMISQYAGINFTDIRPSFDTTTHIMRASLLQDPIFGAGAGRYGDVWNLYRPAEINSTIFWNTPFESGYSLLQSLATTNGALVALTLFALLVLTLITGFKLFNNTFPDRFSRFIAVTSFIMFIAFAGLFIIASPGLVLIVFGFLYLGLLVGVSTLVGKTRVIAVEYLKDPRLSFFAILGLVLLTMAGFTAVYFSGNRFASVLYFNRALAATNIESALSRINRAISLSENDIYWRTRAALFTNEFTSLAQRESADQNVLQSNFSQAEQSALSAVAWDRGNSANWLALSQVYQLVVASGEEAYTNAKQAADEAQARNPQNPIVLLNQAQLSVANKNISEALTYIDQALSAKADYLDAFILRAQIRSGQGNTEAIEEELLKYTKVAPFDPQGFVLLGTSYAESREYTEALRSFGRARELAPLNPTVYLQYISILELMGRKDEAVQELEAFKVKFPGVEGVEEQITRIRTGTASTVPTE